MLHDDLDSALRTTLRHLARINDPPVMMRALLESNGTPKPEQREEIRLMLGAARLDMDQLSESIDVLQLTLDQLKSHRATHLSLLESYQAIISPCRCLPPEVLTRIFMETIECPSLDHDFPRHGSLDVTQGPWPLSQVSRSWREIALCYPQLWSFIAVRWEDPPFPQVSRFETYFLRSEQVGIHVFVHVANVSLPFHSIFHTLLQARHRWKSAYISIPDSLLNRLLLVRDQFSTLQRLKLVRIEDGPGVTVQMNVTSKFPVLKEIHLKAFDFPLPFPWAQITHFVCHHTQSCDLTDVLPHMKNLQEAYFFCSVVCRRQDNDPPIHLGSLRKLDYCLGEENAFRLHHLLVPAVDEMSIHRRSESPITPDLSSMIAASHCSLHTLNLKGRIFYDDDVIDVLGVVPNIVQLRLNETRGGTRVATNLKTFFERLSFRDDQIPTLAPRLQRLILQTELRQFDPAPIIDMISSRWFFTESLLFNAPVKIVEFRFGMAKEVDKKKLFGKLENLEKDGLVFVVEKRKHQSIAGRDN